MAKYSTNPIEGMQYDWSFDPTNGLPFCGQSVQSFIKTQINGKVGAGYFDAQNMALYLFKDDVDKAEFIDDPSRYDLVMGSIPMEFSSTQFRIHVVPRENMIVNATVNQGEIILHMDVQAEMRELGEANWVPTGQDIIVKAYIDENSTGTYKEVPELERTIFSNSGVLEVDMFPYIPAGTSRVRFYFYAKDDATLSTSLVWTITLAEMYIEEWGNMWHEALVEDGNEAHYRLGGFKIVGTIAKTIHIRISTTGSIVASYSRDIGQTEALDNAFFFTRAEGLALASPKSVSGESLPPLTTGVYNVKVWLTAGNLSTEDSAIVYNIMYIAPGDEGSASLVVMNNSGKDVNNYDESAHLCDYALYAGGATYATPHVDIVPYIDSSPGSETAEIDAEQFTETKLELRHNISLNVNTTNIAIRYRITMTDNYQEGNSRVDNSQVFPSVAGETFYLNTSLRSNGESTRETIYNTAGNTSVALSSVQWQNMSWVDGIDGWTEDNDGRRCLYIPARSRLVIPASAFRFLAGEDTTFELCYKVINVSDYSENVISFSRNPSAAGFQGVRIRPTNVTVHSASDSSSENDIYQGTNIADEETVHLVISIQKNFNTQNGFNLVTGYVNGTKNFEFPYPSNTIWIDQNAGAIFGSDTADLCLYFVRFYGRKALSAADAENNWLNSLTTRAEKVAWKSIIQSVLKSSSRQIDYDTIKNGGKYNFFVVEMTSGSPNVPSTSYPDGGRANLEMHYGADANGNSRSGWDWKIYDVEIKGQGTTSMNYWLWNFRSRIDKTDSSGKRLIAYYDDPVISGGVKRYEELPAVASKTVWFDGEGNHPAVKRITAKINFASSMQSHKMGATRAYTLLHDTLLEGAMLNEAQVYAQTNDLPMPTVAVYQYPAFGFQKNVDSLGNEHYEFIGLFTIGPDKGDKPTFGWNLIDDEDLVSLEGTDHTPQMAKFNVPWDEQTIYALNSKKDGFISTKAPDGNFVGALEVGNANGADTEDASEALPALVSSFKPAYDVVYDNSTLIFPIALDDEDYGGENLEPADVLANINADVGNFQSKRYNDRLGYVDMEFWIEGEYKLYHYEYESGLYVSGKKTNGEYGSPLDLRTDTGITDTELEDLTLEQQNELFKAARRARFINDAPALWDMNELVFNYVFLVAFGATDNFAKNQYPYTMGGKWRLRQDDLDTFEDIDNNGGQTKPSDIEFEDAVNGSTYFAGSNSVLWNLVHESLWSDYTVSGVSYTGIKTMGRLMIEKMSELASGQNAYDGFIKFFEKYFWGDAQDYFPQSAYNLDARIKYEAAWLTGRTFSADPLRQSLGDHYSAERLWVRRRAMYCMSLFNAGSFGTYRDASLGRIQFRPIELGSMELTSAESMYPCLIVGNDDIRPTGRTFSGESYKFTSLVGDGNTVYTIQAVHNLTSLGDLKDLRLGSDDGNTFNITGRKLRTFKMGDEDATDDNVTTTVVNLNIDSLYGLPCLEVFDVRNAANLSGTLDLTNCKRLKEVYTEGTKVGAVTLPRGSKIEKLHLSDYVTSLSYQVVKYLSDLVLPTDSSNITLIYLEECDALDGMTTLYTVYSSEGQRLAFIRIVWAGEKAVTAKQLRMLDHIRQNLDKDGESHIYNGVDVSGSGSVSEPPHIEGELLAGAHYPSSITGLMGSGTPEDSTTHPGLKRIYASYFGALYVTYPTGEQYEYIEFESEKVESLCVAANWGDGSGLTKIHARSVTSIGTVFKDRADLGKFDEFQYFTAVQTIQTSTGSSGAFSGSGLKSIVIPSSVKTIQSCAFYNCASLENITIPSTVTTIGEELFYGCSSLEDLTINSTATVTCNVFSNAGKGTGTLRVAGTLTDAAANGGRPLYFKRVLLNNVNLGSIARQFITGSSSTVEELRVAGNISTSGSSATLITNAGGKLKFIELMGRNTGAAPFVAGNSALSVTGCIIHLGYNGVATTPALANATLDRVQVIYVGDGTDDDTVLAAYQADANWSASSALSKLAKWSSYEGEYKNNS